MKKFYLLLLSFIVVSSLLYLSLLLILGNNIKGSFLRNFNYDRFGDTYDRLREADTIANVDVLFFGSSHSYRGFDPRIFKNKGVSSFNLGSNAQTPMQTLVMYKCYINQMRPKMVVFEINPPMFTLDGVESSIGLIANARKNYDFIKMAFKLNSIKIYNILMYGYLRQFLGIDNKVATTSLYNKKSKIDKYISGGFVERKLAYYKPNSEKETKSKLVFLPKQIEAFDEILGHLKKNGIKYMLVQAPITTKVFTNRLNNLEIDNFFKERGPYFNFNYTIHLNDSLSFYDKSHLNQYGVNEFNNKFIEAINLDSLKQTWNK